MHWRLLLLLLEACSHGLALPFLKVSKLHDLWILVYPTPAVLCHKTNNFRCTIAHMLRRAFVGIMSKHEQPTSASTSQGYDW